MQRRNLLIVILLGALLTFPFIAQAQDEGEQPADATAEALEESHTEGETAAAEVVEAEEAVVEEAEETPQGMGLFMLLLGLGGVLAVGTTMIGRENAKPDEDEA